MSEIYEPELGQMAFGCPTSEFACPVFIEAGLAHLAGEIERVEGNIRQEEYEAPTGNNGGEYSTDAFEMRAYWWGECTCGAECPQHATDCDLRTKWDDWISARMDFASGEPDEHGFADVDMSKFGEFEKQTPPPRCSCGANESWKERDKCDPTCRQELPKVITYLTHQHATQD